MSQLINQKFLQGIDSTKFKIAANGALIAINSQGQEVEILKLNAQDQALLLGVKVASQSDLDAAVAAITAEITRAQAAEAQAKSDAEAYTDLKVGDEAHNRDVAISNAIAPKADKSYVDTQDQSILAQAKSYADAGITSLINGAPGALDTLKEIADALGNDASLASHLTNSIAGVQSSLNSEITRAQNAEAAKADKSYVDSAVAGEASSRSAADAAIQAALNAEISRAQTAENGKADKSYVDSAVAAEASARSTAVSGEASARAAADTALDGRLKPIEARALYGNSFFFNDTISGSTPDSQPGSEDPTTLKRDGWYFQNSVSGQGINWYFYDNVTSQGGNIQKSAFSAYAVMTFDAVAAAGAKPIIAVYSYPTGSGDASAGFYHSKWVYQLSQTNLNSISAGKKVLLYVGANPAVHPELQHISLDYISGSSAGSRVDTEVVGFANFIGDSTTAVNKIKWMVEALGVESSAYSMLTQLRIRYAQKANLDAEISARASADSALSGRVSTLETSITSKASTSYVDNAVAGEASSRASAVSSEASARAAADALLLPLDGSKAMSNDLAMGSHKITGMGNGVNPNDAVNKGQLDAAVSGVVQKSYVDTQDAATLASAKSYSDAGNASTLASANSYADSGDASTLASAKTYVDGKITALVGGAPSALDTLKKIDDALANDESVAAALSVTVGNNLTTALNAVSSEQARAQGIEAGLRSSIDAEAARAKKAEYDEAAARIAAITSEASTRASADSALDGRVSQLEAVVWDKMYKSALSSSDIANQYIDLPYKIVDGSLFVFTDNVSLYDGVHFNVSTVNGKSRVSFAGEIASGGVSALDTTDDMFFKFQRK